MIGNFIIPVVNTENGKFEYNGNLDKKTYEEMVSETFWKNNYRIQSFADSMRNGGNFEFGERKGIADKDLDITFSECEALFLNSSKKDYDASRLDEYVENEKMSIIIVNINPNDIDEDAESDLKYWMSECNKILKNPKYNDKTKLEILPRLTFGIKTNENTLYWLKNSKMFEDYSDKKYPLYFALIIEKITKEK